MAKKQYQIDANDEIALKDDFTLTGGALPTGGYVSSLFSSANTSLVAVCKAEGGTKIKQDSEGNYYYEVEEE